MGKIPEFYRTSGEGNVVSVNFTDFLQGRGYLTLYGAKTNDWILTPNQIYSSISGTDTQIYTNNTGDTGEDLTFSGTLSGDSILVNGDVIVQVPTILEATGSSTVTSLISGTLSKVTNGVEESLGVATTKSSHAFGSAGLQGRTATIIFSTSDVVKIQTGDTIKLRVEGSSPGSGNTIRFAHDPQDRATGLGSNADGNTRIIKVDIPVLVDL